MAKRKSEWYMSEPEPIGKRFRWMVFCGAPMSVLESIEGVSAVHDSGVEWLDIWIDPRYDAAEVWLEMAYALDLWATWGEALDAACEVDPK